MFSEVSFRTYNPVRYPMALEFLTCPETLQNLLKICLPFSHLNIFMCGLHGLIRIQ